MPAKEKAYRCMQTSVTPRAREPDREIHIFNFNAASEYSQT